MRLIKILVFKICSFGIVLIAGAQTNVQLPTLRSILTTKWKAGDITFLDGSVISGDLYYDLDKEELRAKINDEQKVFKPDEIYSFGIKSRRDSIETFYSLPYNFAEDNPPIVFFQLRKEFPDFMVLSKKGPEMSYSTPGGTAPSPSGGAPIMTPGTRRVYRPEIFYLLTTKGKMEMFNTFYEKYKTLISFKIQKPLSANMSLLERATTPYFQDIQSYADKHKLSFDEKDDFLKILNYYEILTNNLK